MYLAPSRFQRDGKSVARYSYPCFLVGTLSVDIGMFLCARIIDQATIEFFYRPTEHGNSVIYWLQPGGQKVGDQVFKAFAGSFGNDPKSRGKSYIKSIKNPKTPHESILWLAVGISMIGFVFQFVGARGLHSSVTLAWLGSTLLMTIIRAALRTQRMGEADNLMMQPETRDQPQDLIHGHELDWFALYLEEQSEESPPSEERSFRLITNMDFQRSQDLSIDENSTFDSSVLKTRARLAVLTGPEHLNWEVFPVRVTAQQLKTAIEGTMERLRSLPNDSARNLKSEIKWPIYIYRNQEKRTTLSDGEDVKHGALSLTRSQLGAKWQVDVLELEAVLGIWTWSLLHASSENWIDRRTARILCEDTPDTVFSPPQIGSWFPRAEPGWIFKPETPVDESYFTWVRDEDFHDPEDWSIPLELRGSIFNYCVKTDNSVLQMVAHDVFISFLCAALAGSNDISFNNAIDNTTEVTPSPEHTTYSESQPYFIHNREIDGWAQVFEESKLGSRENAYMCILPVLYQRPHPPIVHGGLKLVREQVEKYKREEKFDLALAMLTWILETFHRDTIESQSDSYRKTIVEALGVIGCRKFDRPWNFGFFSLHNQRSVARAIYSELRNLLVAIDLIRFERLLGCSWEKVSKSFMADITPDDTPGYSYEYTTEGLHETRESLDRDEKNPPHSEHVRVALCWAAKNQQRILFYLLLEKGDAIESRDRNGLTYLMWASKNGYHQVVELLLNENAEIEAIDTTRDGSGMMTSLMLAACNGHERVVELLIESGANLEKKDDEGHTVFFAAAKSGASNVVSLLLDRVDVNARSEHENATALIIAAKHGHQETLARLIHAGADLDATDGRWKTALWHAAANGNIRILNQLVDGGADINTKSNRYELSALSCAVGNEKEEAVKVLLNNGIDVETTDYSGRTALMYAVQGGEENIIELLLKKNASIEARDNNRKTALDFASPSSYDRVERLFRDCKAERGEASEKEGGTNSESELSELSELLELSESKENSGEGAEEDAEGNESEKLKRNERVLEQVEPQRRHHMERGTIPLKHQRLA